MSVKKRTTKHPTRPESGIKFFIPEGLGWPGLAGWSSHDLQPFHDPRGFGRLGLKCRFCGMRTAVANVGYNSTCDSKHPLPLAFGGDGFEARVKEEVERRMKAASILHDEPHAAKRGTADEFPWPYVPSDPAIRPKPFVKCACKKHGVPVDGYAEGGRGLGHGVHSERLCVVDDHVIAFVFYGPCSTAPAPETKPAPEKGVDGDEDRRPESASTLLHRAAQTLIKAAHVLNRPPDAAEGKV